MAKAQLITKQFEGNSTQIALPLTQDGILDSIRYLHLPTPQNGGGGKRESDKELSLKYEKLIQNPVTQLSWTAMNEDMHNTNCLMKGRILRDHYRDSATFPCH